MPTLFNSNKFYTGSLSAITLNPLRLTSLDISTNEGVLVYADSGNLEAIYVGDSNVTAGTNNNTDGFPIPPGKALLIKIDQPNKIFCVTPSGFTGHRAFWMST
jgi:hypothetical protein